MITPEYGRVMMRYNRWQNRSLMAAADSLSDAARWQDRGAFFGSIAATLNHILWDDQVWLARLIGDDARAAEIDARHPYTDAPRDWATFKRERAAFDDRLVAWADGLSATDMARPVRWLRVGCTVETRFGFNLVHLINHQTHHRGQVHSMLTAAGATPEATDLQSLADLP
ncbi:MAG: DinB family protein [Pseudomonadota bacterium]